MQTQEEYLATLNFRPVHKLNQEGYGSVRAAGVRQQRIATEEVDHIQIGPSHSAHIIRYEDGGLHYMIYRQDGFRNMLTDDFAAYIARVSELTPANP